MKREDKYPDTKTFHYFNANPKNRLTGDCVIRSIALGLNKPYNECVMEMAELMCKTGYSLVDKKGIGAYLKSQGWEKHNQPRKADNTKYTGKEFCRWLNKNCQDESVICNIGGHHIVCIKKHEGQYKVHDTWDSTEGSIGNYWTR